VFSAQPGIQPGVHVSPGYATLHSLVFNLGYTYLRGTRRHLTGYVKLGKMQALVNLFRGHVQCFELS
jgi:hypothetical protein